MKCIVAGAKFKGFCDALNLANEDFVDEVKIIEPAPFFGGIAYSREVKGFSVDKGVHFFDSVPRALADIVSEIMDGKVNYIDVKSGSAFNGNVTDGYSLPDLSSLPESDKDLIEKEVKNIARNGCKDEFSSLKDLFYSKFGNKAGEIFCRVFKKIYSIDADEIEPSGLSHTSLHRLKFRDDESMKELKKDSYLDSILAARRTTLGKIDDLVTVYPADGMAMKGWCEAAAKWLSDVKGVDIILGEKIQGINSTNGHMEVITDKGVYPTDKLIWSNDNASALCNALGIDDPVKPFHYGTPMLFATMITDSDNINDYTYIQNFNIDGLTYRTAAAGIYSNQVSRDGLSFITSECPTTIGSASWEDPESVIQDVWAECKTLGVVKETTKLRDHEIIRIPGTFKPPKVGYSNSLSRMEEVINNDFKDIVFRNPRTFFKREIFLDSLQIAELVSR